jgi:Mg2+ and Co2+ transporter CorA
VQVAGIPHPLVILQDLYRIIASEWIAVTTYIERDLNTIEWRLEADENVTLETYESFLGKLFILRRRIGKYKSLVDEQLELCRNQMPEGWGNSTTTTEASIAIQNDLEQVQQLIGRNAQSVDLITTMMSVREGETAINQNERLGFLTVVATVVLPFNAVAAVLAIQTEYGPGQMKFWFFWVAAVAACLFIWLVFVLYRLTVYTRTQIRSRR